MTTNPFSTYGWLKTIEETYINPLRPAYFLVKNRQKLVGAAITYLVAKDEQVSDIDSQLLGRIGKYASRLRFSFLPTLICGTISSFGQHLLADPLLNSNNQNSILNMLLDAIIDYAGKQGLSICFIYLRDDNRRIMDLLKEKGFSHTCVNPYSYIDIEWSSFDEYVKNLKQSSKNIKKSLKREIRKNKKAGVNIEIEKEPGRYQDRLFELINNNHIKYNNTPFFLKKEFVQKLQEYLSENCSFYISRKKGLITGTSLVITKNNTQYIYAVGVDRQLAGNDMTFFNIAFYRPMMDAISNNIRRIDHGLGFHKLKARRGCKIGNYYFSYKASGKLSNLALKLFFLLLSRWYQRKNALILK